MRTSWLSRVELDNRDHVSHLTCLHCSKFQTILFLLWQETVVDENIYNWIRPFLSKTDRGLWFWVSVQTFFISFIYIVFKYFIWKVWSFFWLNTKVNSLRWLAYLLFCVDVCLMRDRFCSLIFSLKLQKTNILVKKLPVLFLLNIHSPFVLYIHYHYI